MLPGVTVEAAESGAHREGARQSVTDGSGQYRIVSLRPGLYSVTFTLTGFSTVKKEGLQLASGFVTTVNARHEGRLAAGNGDGHRRNAGRRRAEREAPADDLDSEMLTSIPTARAANALLTLIPSMVQSGGANVNVQLQPGMVVFGGRGGRSNEGRLQLDGLNTGASVNGGGVSGYTATCRTRPKSRWRLPAGSARTRSAARR